MSQRKLKNRIQYAVSKTAKNGIVRIIAATTTNLVNEGTKIHDCHQ
jgi:hypothetical protein